jgi:alpha,alpha-trehalose-phosphate synthase [UDP-forming]
MVVVANRLPMSRGKNGAWVSSSGGLVTALVPILQKRGGAWIGWTGDAGRAGRLPTLNGVAMRSVGLTDSEIDTYYNGFSNRTLWPLYHDAIREPEFNHAWWPRYEEVNQKFARAAAAAASPGDTVWVHDYHLQLVPKMLRAMRPDLRIGMFLHIPFPPEELFSWLPWRERILEGMLGADLVGFQTYSDAQNFSRAARRYTDADGTDTELRFAGRHVRVNSFPISIDFDWFDAEASKPEVKKEAEIVRQRLGRKRKVLLSVDRLDYTKGIDTRLCAFEVLLQRGKFSVQDCVLVQIAAPSREPVFEYAEMRTKIEQLVGRINGEYSEPGRVAVHYFRRGFTREQLVPYYLAADVMVVTPLRDGMNLVCKEYIATRGDHTGTLVLSEFAGASRQLRRSLLVNPRDVEGTATVMEHAMALPGPEARQRMSILRTMVKRHDVHEWANQYLEALQG